MTFAKFTRTAIVAALLTTTAFAAQARELRMGVITPPSHVWTKVANRRITSYNVCYTKLLRRCI